MSASRPRVLVIEDDECVGELVRHVLEGEGFAVQVAGDGEAGLGDAARQRPDVVLLDVGLPGADGWSVLRSLRRNAVTEQTPVVMMSARFPEAGLPPGGLPERVEGVVAKPFALGRLVRTLKEALPGGHAGGLRLSGPRV